MKKSALLPTRNVREISWRLQMEIEKYENVTRSTNTQQELSDVKREDDESFAKSNTGCDSAFAVVQELTFLKKTFTCYLFSNW